MEVSRRQLVSEWGLCLQQYYMLHVDANERPRPDHEVLSEREECAYVDIMKNMYTSSA